ncbi:FRG domain-containing protein [Arcicella sp. LKC2W]|uniref:FRG domain-containing protein n=1 Tax=Arcicella sp. LKC2W TaxID=2984198 RepID=UPI002B206CAF|nr:FRG domain-containing protein [Arcicella sp. LKC2W]MEA5461917.1 FRG domain-containing protein [Arcicella sp. LKC2W]
MTTLSTYESFDEKSKHFNLVKVETIDDYNKIVTTQQMLNGIYRGINNSKYKIYTSLQRQIILKDLQYKFRIEDYLNNFRQNKILEKYFDTFKIEASKLSIYSYLQHYRAPTPFLDFTTNFEKALYFAIENFEETSNVEQGLIDDYFSIFFINQTDFDLIEIPEVIRSLKPLKRLSNDLFSQYEDYTHQHLVSHIDNIFTINTCNVFLISHYEEFIDIYNTYNNIRIVAQEGLFIHNDYLDKPLEEALKEFFKEATIFVGSALDEIDDPQIIANNEKYREDLEKNRGFQQRLEKNIITSFEIKKSLICEIRKSFSLQKGDIYPDPEKLCRQIFKDSLPK